MWLQVYYLLGVPHAFLLTTSGSRQQLLFGILGVLRSLFAWLGITVFYGSLWPWFASLGFYGLLWICCIYFYSQGSFRVLAGNNKLLYYGAHFSVFNFAFDVCGRGLNDLRIQHWIFLAANAVCAVILLVGLFLVSPWRRAWGCYCKSDRSNPWKLDRGLCPMYTDFYDPPSTANSGENNLICRDLSFASSSKCGNHDACITGQIDDGLPRYWHLVTMIAMSSFTVSLSLIRAKVREINISAMT